MTVASEIRKSDAYVGNGIATEFVFPFKVFLASDLQVVVADELGAEAVLELDAAYQVELNENQNADPGGTVTLFDPLPDGHTLVITSNVPELQPVDLANQGGFYPSVVTAALDRLTILVQQLRERLSRAAVLPITSDADADTLVSSILVISGIQQQLADIAANLSAIAAAGAVADEIAVVAGISNDIQVAAGIADEIGDVAAIAAQIQAVSDNLLGILAAEQAAVDAVSARDAAQTAQALAEDAADEAEAAAAVFDPGLYVARTGGATGAADLPAGTTAQRPAGAPGRVRFNSSNESFEGHGSSGWMPFAWMGNTRSSLNAGNTDFLDIPPWVTEVAISFQDLIMSSTVATRIQLGTSGGFVTSGYIGARFRTTAAAVAGGVALTDSFSFEANSATNFLSGIVLLKRMGRTNVWTCSGQLGRQPTAGSAHVAGHIDLGAGVMNSIRISPASGTITGGFASVDVRA